MNKKPIIMVFPRKDKDIHPIKGGGGRKVFEFNEIERRRILSNELTIAHEQLNNQFKKYPGFPGVLKVSVRSDAIAKTHKPYDFFGKMKVLTYGSLTEIYISASKADIETAINNCNTRTTKNFVADISSILSIQSVLPENKDVRIDDNTYHNIVVSFFDYGSEKQNDNAELLFSRVTKNLNVEQKTIRIGKRIHSRIIKHITAQQIRAIMDLPFVMSVRETVSFCSNNLLNKIPTGFEPKWDYTENGDCIIGIVDGGISETAIPSKYIYARESFIPNEFKDTNHGTFVASTILFGNEINKRNEATPVHFKLLDVAVIPSSNSPVSMYEDEFCECLRDSVEKYHDSVKIWNLSLGFKDIIANDKCISSIGSFCDALQQEYEVQFIIAAGNYEGTPYRKWPMPLGNDNDRIIAPADSIAAITVGSLAEKESGGSLSKINQPSPFSKRGPGACFLFKPDLIDYGGNMFSDGTYLGIGVEGLDENGSVCEDLGTSFSTPIISYKYAKIYSSLTKKNTTLSKALLVHDALRHTEGIFKCSKEERYYFGFGIPSNDCEQVLNCNDNEITIVFECNIQSGSMVDIKDFPFPKSMVVNNKYKGEIFATLVAEPCFNVKYGSEYSRIDFELSIGTFCVDNGKITYSRQVEPLKANKLSDFKYESELLKEELKWNPVKAYHRKMKNGIEEEDGWAVKIQLHSRFGESTRFHKCYVVITFIGSSDDVYDETIKAIREQGFEYYDIEIASEIRTPIIGE